MTTETNRRRNERRKKDAKYKEVMRAQGCISHLAPKLRRDANNIKRAARDAKIKHRKKMKAAKND